MRQRRPSFDCNCGAAICGQTPDRGKLSDNSNVDVQEVNMADQSVDSSVSKTQQKPTGLTRRTFTRGLALAPLSVARAATNPTDPSLFSGAQLVSAYYDRSLSPPDVVTAIFKRISDVGQSANAFVVTDEEGATRQAQASAAR
jgi:hypothetical protein